VETKAWTTDKEEQGPKTAFRGYAPPTSSTTYTPNQFFDVVLPHASRGCLRLVAFLIRKTLGWSDEKGNPQNPEAYVSYRDLIERAGISRGAIKDSIQEALDKRFIQCLRFGQAHRPNEEGFSALYSLKWDDSERYIANPETFDGFFAGNGNLTHIPNDFFDFTIPNEPLAVVQVIGVIIRNTIGFQTKFGFRVQEVQLSFSDIMRRTGINSRTTVSGALKTAVEGCHIRRVEHGVFDPNAGVESKATVYAIRWADSEVRPAIEATQMSLFELESGDGSKTGPGGQSKKRTGSETVQKLDRSSTVQKVDRGDSSKTGPAKRSENGPATVQELDSDEFKKRTDIKTTNINNTPKQQQTAEGDVVGQGGSLSLLTGKLMAEGVESSAARRLVENFSGKEILQQIEWLPSRNVRASKAGFLIRAIERNMAAPGVQTSEQSSGQTFAAHFYAGLAGNPDEPTAEPSTEDVRLSEGYIQRLPAKLKPNVLGRKFATHVQGKEQGRTSPIRTLGLALRLYGDEFYAANSSQQAQIDGERLVLARTEHKSAFQKEYEAYVANSIEKLTGNPEVSVAFEEFTEKRLATRKRMSDRAYEMLQKQLRTEEGRQQFFMDFLEQSRHGNVLGFWEWDATINDKPFSTEGAGL